MPTPVKFNNLQLAKLQGQFQYYLSEKLLLIDCCMNILKGTNGNRLINYKIYSYLLSFGLEYHLIYL